MMRKTYAALINSYFRNKRRQINPLIFVNNTHVVFVKH